MKKKYAVIGYEDESFYSVIAVKLFEGSWKQCSSFLHKNDTLKVWDIAENFEGSEVNADFVQGFRFWDGE